MMVCNDSSDKNFHYLRTARFWLAGPATLLVSILIMAAMSLWLPKGIAGINNLVIPLILFPLFWSVVFFYVVLENHFKRMYLIMSLLLITNGGLVLSSINGWIQ